jgi:hypothetical protein
METLVTLRVLGVDFDDVCLVEKIATHLSDLSWAVVDGVAFATLQVASGDAVSRAIDTARRIEHALPESRVDQLDEELVAIPDISARAKVHRETIRTWINGTRGLGGFPLPRASLGGGDRGSMKVWRWADVNRWLDENYSLGDGYSYLTDAQFAEINAYLARAEYMLTMVVQNTPFTATQFTQARILSADKATIITTATSESAPPALYNVRVEASQ